MVSYLAKLFVPDERTNGELIQRIKIDKHLSKLFFVVENKNGALFAQMFFVDERRNGEPLVQTFLCGECKRDEFMHRRENGKFLVQTFLCD